MVTTQPGWENTLASTCRCLTEDLACPPSSCEGSLESWRHLHVVNAFLERRSVHPTGSESPIQQLRPLLAYSLHSGRQRGVTWHQERFAIVWLLSSHTHREDSVDDAYNYFERLHRAGRLLPTRADAARVITARQPKFDMVVTQEIPAIRTLAEGSPGAVQDALLGGRIPVRVLYEDGEVGLLIVAVSTRVRPDALPLPSEWLGVVLAGFFPDTSLQDLDGVADLGGAPLRSDELGFCALLARK